MSETWRITKDDLPMPVDAMERFRKVATTPMCRVSGPVTFETQEGEYPLPEGWEGWCAVDQKGFPYPIAAEEQSVTYEPDAP